MRTSVPSIYAVGDLAGRFLFTHSAGYEAANAIRNMFFPGSTKATDFVPWCTFTDPELAHAGLTPAEAEAQHGADDCMAWRLDLDHSDRARADGAEAGAIVVVTAKKKIVGAHILAPAAGEMIHELALAIHAGAQARGPLGADPRLSDGLDRDPAARGGGRVRESPEVPVARPTGQGGVAATAAQASSE